ncbi:uncharacterized protein LOC116624524 [Phoca vitulina]|uniref:uncharacterized protein LOC116624524 n=1 Tax=Phoca vitulina TaxID=9720 RepID=UPI0013961022|nr:uncharacterized protein LOC116624524 [Phoca vitulina]
MQAPERSWESWVRLSAKSSPPPRPPENADSRKSQSLLRPGTSVSYSAAASLRSSVLAAADQWFSNWVTVPPRPPGDPGSIPRQSQRPQLGTGVLLAACSRGQGAASSPQRAGWPGPLWPGPGGQHRPGELPWPRGRQCALRREKRRYGVGRPFLPLPSPDGQQSTASSREPQPPNLPSCVHSERLRLADPKSIQRPPSPHPLLPPSLCLSFWRVLSHGFPSWLCHGHASPFLALARGMAPLRKGTLGDLGADRCAWRFPGAWARGPRWAWRPWRQICKGMYLAALPNLLLVQCFRRDLDTVSLDVVRT